MNEKVKKVFEILGVEPNERFKIERCGNPTTIYTIDENLIIIDDKENIYETLLVYLLRGDCKIIKLPKELNKIKKKIRDLTPEEWDKWQRKNCGTCNCNKCAFDKVSCEASYSDRSWINNKNIYSDEFLTKEIEVE